MSASGSDIGYCTVDDVREALRKRELSGDLNTDLVETTILGQTEWLQETTNRHWYEPTGLDDDSTGLISTDPLTHANDEQDVPSSAHADPVQMQVAAARQARYPVRHAGPYTRVLLGRRDVREVTELLVRTNTGDYTDWVASDEYAEGRGEDYYLHVDDSNGASRLYLHTGPLPRLSDYDNAVSVSYEYGIPGITGTVRRAIALKVASELVFDDDAQVGIPDSGQLVQLESKAQAMQRKAEELLEIHR